MLRIHKKLSKKMSPSLISILLISTIIPLSATALAELYLANVYWQSKSVYALLQTVNAFIAILFALLILVMSENHQLAERHKIVASTLFAMGIFNLFQSSIQPWQDISLLHKLAGFAGGMILLLVPLPRAILRQMKLNAIPYLFAGLSLTAAIMIALLPQLLPDMAYLQTVSVISPLLTIAGATGFMLAGIYFIAQKDIDRQSESYLLANFCLLFSVSNLLLYSESTWSLVWWLWHLFQLFTYLAVFYLFSRIYQADHQTLKLNQMVQKHQNKAVEIQRNQLKDMLENSPSPITLKDLSGQFIAANKKFYDVMALTDRQIIGKTTNQVFPKNSFTIEMDRSEPDWDAIVAAENRSIEHEATFHKQSGDIVFHISRFPLKSRSGQVYGVGCIFTDITERKSMEQRLQLAQKVMENTNEAVIVTDQSGIVIEVNKAYTEITGYDYEELIGHNPKIHQSGWHDKEFYKNMWQEIHKNGHWSGEIWDRRKSGELYPKWLTINAIKDENNIVTNYVGLFNDISEKKDAEKALENLAYYDFLTQLPNRVLFHERLIQDIANAKRGQTKLAVMMVDLDQFKFVNDTLGHDAGDKLLELVADQMRPLVRESDTIARLGGDEFAIIVADLNSSEDASIIANNIINTLQKSYQLKGVSVNIGASIGISTYPSDSISPEGLVKNADLALYKAKDEGRNNYQFFSKEIQNSVYQHVAMEQEISRAIQQEQFSLYYQPKLDLASKNILGMEALVRWIHPERGIIQPDEFVPFAEETGQIIPLGDWILRTAVKQTAEWAQKLDEPITVAINLSPKQFKQKSLPSMLKSLLEEFQLDPKLIELEITESSIMSDKNSAKIILDKLHKVGVKLAINDFGLGQSSLGYLKHLPISTLKIDRSFIREVTINREDSAIVESIISLAEKLQLDVVAEGVETEIQLDFLTKHGCQNAQGYLLVHPLTTADFDKHLKKLKRVNRRPQ